MKIWSILYPLGLLSSSAATSTLAFQTPTRLTQRCENIFSSTSLDDPHVSHSSSTAKLSRSCLQSSGVDMAEILNVNIFDPHALDPPFEDRVSQLLPRKSDVYISFTHRGKFRGKSITFDNADEAWANLPLVANEDGKAEPLICEIKQQRRILKDKTLYIAKMFLGNDKPNHETRMGEITGKMRDLNGNDTGLRLRASTFSTEWDTEYVDREDGHRKMDLFFRFFMKLLKVQVANMDLGGANILQRPKAKADKNLEKEVLLGGLIEYPKKDEFLTLPLSAKLLIPAMNKLLFNSESTCVVRDRALSTNEVRLKLHNGVTSPAEGRWVRPMSDESMHRVFFSSMGMHYIEKDKETDGYVADLTYLNKLSYKPLLEKLGCRTFFDANGDITMIEDSDKTIYRPGDEFWEWAKIKSRSACFTFASLEHITSYHFTWACAPGMALRMFLPPTHPIRMAFTAHFFRTHYTCSKAQDSLLDERSVLGRALPFKYKEGLEKSYKKLLDDFKFVTYPDELESKGLKDCKYHIGSSDGLDLHKVMMDYASNMFDEVYSTEERFEADENMRELYNYLKNRMEGVPSGYSMTNMKLVWGEILFRVTGDHNMIGNAAAYALDPQMVNFRMLKENKGKAYTSQESRAAVVGITGITMPNEYPKLSQDWSQVLRDPNSKAYETLRTDLEKLAESIDKRNKSKKRRFVNKDFHPDYTAVSVFS